MGEDRVWRFLGDRLSGCSSNTVFRAGVEIRTGDVFVGRLCTGSIGAQGAIGARLVIGSLRTGSNCISNAIFPKMRQPDLSLHDETRPVHLSYHQMEVVLVIVDYERMVRAVVFSAHLERRLYRSR